MASRPRLAVFKFASCDGCQLSLLSLEDELLALSAQIEVVYFLEATSRIEPGPYDIALIEGSITTATDAQRIQQIRSDSRFVVTIGACATSGGIQSLRNWADHQEYLQAVYAKPEYIESLATSTGIAEHIHVDFELRGCPINKYQLLEVLTSLIHGQRPHTPSTSVCIECKRKGNVCIVVTENRPCIGPITQAGCGALCPTYNRVCYGCFGPCGQPNVAGWSDHRLSHGETPKELIQLLHGFNVNAEEFRKQSSVLAQKQDSP